MSVSLPPRERLCDLTGYPVTCSSQEALDFYNSALKSLVSGVENFGLFYFRALQLDDAFVLAHCTLVGRLILLLEISLALHRISTFNNIGCHLEYCDRGLHALIL